MAQKVANPKKEKELKKQPELAEKPISTRGRTFEGFVAKRFPSRVVIEFDNPVYVPKYERFFRKKTRIHAKLPSNMDVEVGDYVKVQECRPLSKIIHHVVIQKMTSAAETGAKK